MNYSLQYLVAAAQMPTVKACRAMNLIELDGYDKWSLQ